MLHSLTHSLHFTHSLSQLTWGSRTAFATDNDLGESYRIRYRQLRCTGCQHSGSGLARFARSPRGRMGSTATVYRLSALRVWACALRALAFRVEKKSQPPKQLGFFLKRKAKIEVLNEKFKIDLPIRILKKNPDPNFNKLLNP